MLGTAGETHRTLTPLDPNLPGIDKFQPSNRIRTAATEL